MHNKFFINITYTHLLLFIIIFACFGVAQSQIQSEEFPLSLHPPLKIAIPENISPVAYSPYVYEKTSIYYPIALNAQDIPVFPRSIYLESYYLGWQMALGHFLKYDFGCHYKYQKYTIKQFGPPDTWISWGVSAGYWDCMNTIKSLSSSRTQDELIKLAKNAFCIAEISKIKTLYDNINPLDERCYGSIINSNSKGAPQESAQKIADE